MNPEHCGVEMDCIEYHADDDVYTFQCGVCGHECGIANDDEVWE